jgi:hypothetical protein
MFARCYGASKLPATAPRAASCGSCALARLRPSTCGDVVTRSAAVRDLSPEAKSSHGRSHRFDPCHAHQHKRCSRTPLRRRLSAGCQQTADSGLHNAMSDDRFGVVEAVRWPRAWKARPMPPCRIRLWARERRSQPVPGPTAVDGEGPFGRGAIGTWGTAEKDERGLGRNRDGPQLDRG